MILCNYVLYIYIQYKNSLRRLFYFMSARVLAHIIHCFRGVAIISYRIGIALSGHIHTNNNFNEAQNCRETEEKEEG